MDISKVGSVQLLERSKTPFLGPLYELALVVCLPTQGGDRRPRIPGVN